MSLLQELERLGRAVAAAGGVGDVEVRLPRRAYFALAAEAMARTLTILPDRKPLERDPMGDRGMQCVEVRLDFGTVRAVLGEDA